LKLLWWSGAWEDYLDWQRSDPQTAQKINTLIRDAMRSPCRGLGKPEPLRHELRGFWSRRISDEHRLVYRVAGTGDEQRLEIVQCRFHYDR
jgi:toxin YoeB